MKILIAGSTGLVGSRLVSFLEHKNFEVVRLVRGGSGKEAVGSQCIQWEPARGKLNKTSLEGFDAVIHLGGDNIASSKWSEKKKHTIRASRVKGTELLASTIASLNQKPKVFICASSIGFYGDRANEILTEESDKGEGFLANTCQEWEFATAPAARSGIRVVNLRIGVVLDSKGGALKKMLPAFKMGFGGAIGSGKQYMSWIAMEDLLNIIETCLSNINISGPVNTVSPSPVTNKVFTSTLGNILSRPTFFNVPSFAIKMLLGEMGRELLLASSRVSPKKLKDHGYDFKYPDLKSGLVASLK